MLTQITQVGLSTDLVYRHTSPHYRNSCNVASVASRRSALRDRRGTPTTQGPAKVILAFASYALARRHSIVHITRAHTTRRRGPSMRVLFGLLFCCVGAAEAAKSSLDDSNIREAVTLWFDRSACRTMAYWRSTPAAKRAAAARRRRATHKNSLPGARTPLPRSLPIV